MANFMGTNAGRPVEIEIYDEGGYRVHNTRVSGDSGSNQGDDSSHHIMHPAEMGQKITIEGESPEEIRDALISDGFSEKVANEIVGKLSA